MVLQSRLDGAEIHAADLSPEAAHLARRNLPKDVTVYTGDLYDALPPSLQGRITLLTANVPYVPTPALPTLPREARLFDPPAALDGGPDGLRVAGRVAAGAASWLAPGGHLLMEAAASQVDSGIALLASHGLEARAVVSDEWECAVLIGQRPPALVRGM
jgi:release factor glutamine methyltransferase